jgi:hypothetical protein
MEKPSSSSSQLLLFSVVRQPNLRIIYNLIKESEIYFKTHALQIIISSIQYADVNTFPTVSVNYFCISYCFVDGCRIPGWSALFKLNQGENVLGNMIRLDHR